MRSSSDRLVPAAPATPLTSSRAVSPGTGCWGTPSPPPIPNSCARGPCMTRPVRTRPRLRLRRPPVRPRPEAERGRNGGGRAVRATQRARALAGVRAWYATADIARHATVLAALVAAASLAVSAWGTFKAAQVADDQLAQSRDNTEAATRRQVSQITMWLQPLDGHRTYVIANRSLDAASLYLQIDYGPDGHEAAHLLRVGVAPPCTRMELCVRSAHLAIRTPPRNRPRRGPTGSIT